MADDEAALHCPLCNYSLRGLVDPRCPECGFAFAWAELREAARNKHPYLFEHGAGRNLRTFWLTFWRDCRPRRFWRELSPAHPIHLRRLVEYWLINFGLLIVVPFVAVADVVQQASHNAAMRRSLVYLQTQLKTQPSRYPGLKMQNLVRFQQSYPPATSFAFWRTLITHFQPAPVRLTVCLVESGWVAVTLLTLLIFQQSMRRKNIRNTHLVRVAVYCCDYPVLIAIASGVAMTSRNYSVLFVICVLFLMSTYRLYFAYARYLRLSFPLLTVLSAQSIVALIMIAILLNYTRECYGWSTLRW